jgi:hypothetical protein
MTLEQRMWDVQWMELADCGCTKFSEISLLYVARTLERQLGPERCYLCHSFIYTDGQDILIKRKDYMKKFSE